MEWKTIDSAPKDGTRILGWFPDLNNPAQFTWWVSEESREFGKVVRTREEWGNPGLMSWSFSAPEKKFSPTHWLPLDSPNL